MTARLPAIDGDQGTWGAILNEFLGVAHNNDGTLQSSALNQAGGVTSGTTAGGDLSGTYPNPTVARVNGVSVNGTAAAGKILTASSASAASWQTNTFVTRLGGSAATTASNPFYNVKDYGAKIDGATDDSAAINAAITAASATGGVVIIPAGIVALSGTITLASNVSLVGVGQDIESTKGTILRPLSNYGDVISLPAGIHNFAITQLAIVYTGINQFSSSASASSHAAIKFTIATSTATQSIQGLIEDVVIIGMKIGVYMPWLMGTSLNYAQYYQIAISRVQFAANGINLLLNGFSDSQIQNVICNNTFGVTPITFEPRVAPVAIPATPSATYAATSQNFINDLGNSSVDKLEVYGGIGDGIVFQDCVTTSIRSCESGSLTGNGATMLGCNTQTVIYGLHCALISGYGLFVTDSATSNNPSQDCQFYGMRIDTANLHGIYVHATNAAANRLGFFGCQVNNNSATSANVYNGLELQAADVLVVGGTYSDYQPTPTQKYGINNRYAGSAGLTVLGAEMKNNITGPMAQPNDTTGRMIGNFGLNNTGFGTFTPGVPATGSGNAIGNGNAYDITIYMSGTAPVGLHIIDVNNADQSLAGNPTTIRLHPNEKIYFATTAPGAWVWYGE